MSARVHPGIDLPGITVRLEDLEGNVLSSGVSGADGRVTFPANLNPRDGRVVAILPNSSVELAAEFRGLDPSGQLPTISLLTTLASRLAQREGGTSLPQAEAQVRRLVGVPDTYPLAYGEPNPFFSSLALIRAARQQGGWDAFSSALLARANNRVAAQRVAMNGVNPLYPLTSDALLENFSGQGDLSDLAVSLQGKVKNRLGLSDAQLARTRGSGSLAELSTLGQFVLGVSQGISGNVIQGITMDIVGAVLSAAGMQSATQQQIDAIEKELSELLFTLTTFVDAARNEELKAQIEKVEELFIGSRDTAEKMVVLVGGTPVTGQPYSTPGSMLQLASTLRDGGSVSIDTLRNANIQLGGTNGIIRAYMRDFLKGRYGLNPGGATPATPWFVDMGTSTQFQDFYLHFAREQMLALYLLSEDAHVGFPGTTSPVATLQQVQGYFDQTITALKEQAQLIPWPMSNPDVLVDVQYNSIYARGIFAVTDNPGAIQTNPQEATFIYPDGSTGTYGTPQTNDPPGLNYTNTDFAIADDNHMGYLQQRGSQCPSPGAPGVSLTDPNYNSPNQVGGINVDSNQVGNIGITTAGLAALGFENLDTYYNGNHPYDGQMWVSHDDYYYGLNTMTSEALDNASLDSRPYILSSDLIYDSGTASPGACLQWGTPISIEMIPGAQISSPVPVDFVLPFTGTPGTFTIPQNSLEFVAQVNYRIETGGPVVAGDQNPTTVQAPILSANGTVSTAPTGSGQAPNRLREIVNWSSSNPRALKFYNVPGLGGYATPLQANVPVVVTATILKPSGERVLGTLRYTTPSQIAPHTLQSLQILPRNQIYGAAPSQSSRGTFPYYCVGYYSDLTLEDVSSQVQWNISGPNTANAQIINTGSGVALSMNQPPQATPVPYNLTVTATLSGQTDSTQIQIVAPVGTP